MPQRHFPVLRSAAAAALLTVFVASPALAVEGPAEGDPLARAAESVSEVQEATDATDSVAGYGVTTSGESIVLLNASYKDAPELTKLTPTLDVDAIAFVDPAIAEDATDVVGGAGYFGEAGGGSAVLCSVGFTAWSPAGKPALVTAGHCTNDGAISDVWLSKPSTDAAHAGNNDGVDTNGTGVAGRFGFSQFGGPGNTPGEQNAPDATDIGVIDLTNSALTLHPSITDWSGAAADDLAASTTVVKNIAAPVSGSVSKSGRTTGVTSGNTSVTLLYDDGSLRPTEILDGYMQVSGRWVHGFLGGALSSPGDSGGAVYQGGQAVGVVSGSPGQVTAGDDWSWYTRLVDALEFTGGYTVALDIDAPTVTSVSSGDVLQPGATVKVQVPENATELSVARDANAAETLPVDQGTATVTVPTAPGDYTFALTAINGFSSSAATQLEVKVAEAVAQPTIDEVEVEAEVGERSAPVVVTGSGIAGATVAVAGLGTGAVDATVAEDGTWSLAEHTLEIGAHELTATQRVDDRTSAKSTGTIIVAPAAPEITSLSPDETFTTGSAPTKISGTGLPGAELTLGVLTDDVREASRALVNEDTLDTDPELNWVTVTVDEDGQWSAPVDGVRGEGSYLAVATQELNSIESMADVIGYSITDTATVGGGKTNPGTPGTVAGLPVTGGGPLLPAVVGAALIALLGGGTVLAARRLAARTQ